MRCSECDAYRGVDMSTNGITADEKRQKIWSHLGTVKLIFKIAAYSLACVCLLFVFLSLFRSCVSYQHESDLKKREAEFQESISAFDAETCRHVVQRLSYANDTFACPHKDHVTPSLAVKDDEAWATCSCKDVE